MGRFAADDAGDVALGGHDGDALAKHDLLPPAAQGGEFEVAFLGDVLDHEADFVHVAGEHDAGRFGGALFFEDDAAEAVVGYFAFAGEAPLKKGLDAVFVAGRAGDFADFFEPFERFVHVCVSPPIVTGSVRRWAAGYSHTTIIWREGRVVKKITRCTVYVQQECQSVTKLLQIVRSKIKIPPQDTFCANCPVILPRLTSVASISAARRLLAR